MDTLSSTEIWHSSNMETNVNETRYLDVSPFAEFNMIDGVPFVVFPKYNNYPLREDHSVEIMLSFNKLGIKTFHGMKVN